MTITKTLKKKNEKRWRIKGVGKMRGLRLKMTYVLIRYLNKSKEFNQSINE